MANLVPNYHDVFDIWRSLLVSLNYTLPETNIAPEHTPSQKETSTPTIHFQGLCWGLAEQTRDEQPLAI